MPLTGEMREQVLKSVSMLNEKGLRVLGLAQRTNPSPAGVFSVEDEREMVLIGYLAFLDLPKPTTAGAVEALQSHGVDVKVLTGDNEKVARCICDMVGIPSERMLLGEELEKMTDQELRIRAEEASIFAKLSPEQKARVVETLRENGHSVGYLGDGINDSAAMKASDVGISVDNAVDIAKECAQVILLKKDLLVLEEGRSGRPERLCQHDEIHPAYGSLQFREYVFRAGGLGISALPAHGGPADPFAEHGLRSGLHGPSLGSGGRGGAAPSRRLGRGLCGEIHVPYGAGQLGFRHSDLSAFVFCGLPRRLRRRLPGP